MQSPDEPTNTVRLVIGPDQVQDALQFPARHYETLRFDVSTNCNLRCSYCQVGHGKTSMDGDKAAAFLRNNVLSVRDCVVGCAMEPTLYRQLTEFMALVHRVRPPERDFALQTNGTLLARHDYAQMRDAGLNVLFLSIDSVNPATMRELRDGTDLGQVLKDVDNMRSTIPGLDLRFSSVVSRGNRMEVEDLLDFAVQNGVSQVWLREVCYDPSMPPSPDMTLGLQLGEFAELEEHLSSKYANSTTQVFFLTNEIVRHDVQSYEDSFRGLRKAL